MDAAAVKVFLALHLFIWWLYMILYTLIYDCAIKSEMERETKMGSELVLCCTLWLNPIQLFKFASIKKFESNVFAFLFRL